MTTLINPLGPGVQHWVYRDAYNVLTITAWRPWKVVWRFVVEDYSPPDPVIMLDGDPMCGFTHTPHECAACKHIASLMRKP
jgi:hypothetical protein